MYRIHFDSCVIPFLLLRNFNMFECNPASLSPSAAQILQRLNQAKGWDTRYRELLLLAKEGPQATQIRQSEHEVQGCQAKVWLKVAYLQGRLSILTASESRLIHALLLVMTAPLQGQTLAFLKQFSFTEWFEKCQLQAHINPSRASGLQQVQQQLYAQAETL